MDIPQNRYSEVLEKTSIDGEEVSPKVVLPLI